MSTSVVAPTKFSKRLMDLLLAGVGGIVLAPVALAVAALVRVKLGSPVLFRQDRPGKNARIFRLYKFRTMVNADESAGLVTNEQRMTVFGRWLRSTSLDELPSLWNVLRGDMSIVGPRPLRVEYLGRYDERQARRHEVRPGITGLAQVSGRNALGWDERLELDVRYVERQSLALDASILLKTFVQVARRNGIEGDGSATMSAFMGSADSSGLIEAPLSDEWLSTRVEWLGHPSVRDGVSLSFTPDIVATRAWWATAKSDRSRRDWVYLDQARRAVVMCGLTDVGGTDLRLYIYVDPERQGRGYGGAAMRKLMTRAQSLGARRLLLEVKETNARAIRLYQHLGFDWDGNVPGVPSKRRMVKMLVAAAT